MKKIYTSWHFSRKYRQYLQLANLSQGLLSEQHSFSQRSRITLEHLNTKKMACQMEIGNLNLPSIADCKACISGCCGEPSTYYFTPIDYWLARHGSPRMYIYRQLPQEPFHNIFKKRLIELLRRTIPFQQVDPVPHQSGLEPCEHLGEQGCALSHNERPIKCHMFVCSRLRTAMDDATKSAYLKLTEQLYCIARETFEVLKKEAGLPPQYGAATLILTL